MPPLALVDLTDVDSKTGTGNVVVMQGSPTITTPTIASFVNSAHDHSNAAGGGQLTSAAFASITGTGAAVFATSPSITTPTITGQLKAAVGTAAAPSVSGPAGTSGMFVTATPTVGFSLAGVQKLLADVNGRVLIGDNTAQDYLSVGGTGWSAISESVRVGAINTLIANNLRGGNSGADDSYRTIKTHAVVGYAGISFGYPGRITFFVSGQIATTADAVVVPASITKFTNLGVRIQKGTGELADPSDLLHVATTGSANALRVADATGNSGFGAAPLSAGYRMYVTETAGTAITGSTVSGVSVYAQTAGALSGNAAASYCIWAHRNSTLGAFDITSPLVLVEDATASTGNLQRWRKQGADVAVLSPTGNLTLAGLTASRPVRTTAGKVLESFQVAAQADSTAILLADLVTDFNALLAKHRTQGLMAT